MLCGDRDAGRVVTCDVARRCASQASAIPEIAPDIILMRSEALVEQQ